MSFLVALKSSWENVIVQAVCTIFRNRFVPPSPPPIITPWNTWVSISEATFGGGLGLSLSSVLLGTGPWPRRALSPEHPQAEGWMQLLHLPQPSISWAKISQRPGDRLLEGEQGTGEQPGWPLILGGSSLGILGSTEVSFSLTLHSEDPVWYFPVRFPSSFFLLNPVQVLRTRPHPLWQCPCVNPGQFRKISVL